MSTDDRRPGSDPDRAERLRTLADSGAHITADEYRSRSRRSFLFGGLGAVAGLAGWRFVQDAPAEANIPAPLRGALEFNESIWTSVYRDGRSVPTFDVADAEPLRVNGTRGMLNSIDVDAWRLRVEGPDGSVLDEHTIDDVTGLGEEELVVEHKCIEGWSSITHWGGVPFARFAEPYLREIGRTEYVSIVTVDRRYYVGLDLEAALHPQVLLGTRLDGEPLDLPHGAPLRLVSPHHYGIKSIKQIGSIRFTDDRPADFWAERGYDWHSQH